MRWPVLLLLAGCATANPIYTPEGKAGHSVSCSGMALNWGHCYEKAGAICGAKGYNIIAQTGDQGMIASANQYGGMAGSVLIRSMIVQCKD